MTDSSYARRPLRLVSKDRGYSATVFGSCLLFVDRPLLPPPETQSATKTIIPSPYKSHDCMAMLGSTQAPSKL